MRWLQERLDQFAATRCERVQHEFARSAGGGKISRS
jgi:hypothetical protein